MSFSGDQTSLPDSSTQFSSLRSRWHILREWRKATAESISATVLAGAVECYEDVRRLIDK
eukprot:scaffold322792_cov83-Cyclotella_meneghiniana.AAC.2